MGDCIHFYRNKFLRSLNMTNRDAMSEIDVGNLLTIDSECGSILKGKLESFEEDGIILLIGKKSKIVIKGESIKNLKKIKV